MRTAALAVLFALSVHSAEAVTLRFGPCARLLFPSVEDPLIISELQDLDHIFLPSDPEVIVGASVMMDFIPSLPLEISGSYVGYEPELVFGDAFPDSTEIIETFADLAVVSLGLRRSLGELYLQAGSDILFFKGSWVRVYGSDWGYHEDYKGTTWAPFLGFGKDLHSGVAEFDVDLRLHLPDLSDRWISAGLSVLFH